VDFHAEAILFLLRGTMKKHLTVNSETLKCYRGNATRMIAVWIIAGMLFFIWAAMSTGSVYAEYRAKGVIPVDTLIVFAVFTGLIIWMTTGLWAASKGTFLLLSDRGVEYVEGWYHIFTTWDNVQEFQTHLAPQLILKSPVGPAWKRLLSRDYMAGRKIALWAFDTSLTSELVGDLRRYAPHLFLKSE
jgi:hypothetical protein